MSYDIDFVLYGAGPAGCTAADILARRGAKVLLLDRQLRSEYCVGEHIAPHAMPAVIQSGIPQDELRLSHIISPGIESCWNTEAPAVKDYLFSAYSSGLNLDRPLLNRQFEAMVRSSGVVVEHRHLSKPMRSTRGCFEGEIVREKKSVAIRCHGVIDATGRVRAFARQESGGIHLLNRQVAVASWYSIDSNSGCSAKLAWVLLEATEYGWWYSLLVPGNRLVVVLICNGNLIKGSRTERDKLLQNLIEQAPHTRDRLSRTQKCLHRGVWLANTSYLTNLAGAGWVAVGDCAASFDPVIGSGIAHALKSATSGANAMLKFLDGEHDALDAYAEAERTLIQRNLEFQVQAYRLEQRWPTSSFWSKAQNPSSPT
jgi:flavin-dependent dehydrogenase